MKLTTFASLPPLFTPGPDANKELLIARTSRLAPSDPQVAWRWSEPSAPAALALAPHAAAARHERAGADAAAFDHTLYVEPLYNCILARLTAQDQDQEVKETAIMCMGQLIATLGDGLQAQLPTCLPMLLDR